MKPLQRRIAKLENAADRHHRRIRGIIGQKGESEPEAITRYNTENPTDPIMPDDEVMMIVRVMV